MTALYLCYQSVCEPLTETQVIAYLEGLARAGHKVLLLTFEPRSPTKSEELRIRTRLNEFGIQWFWRRYHKGPSVPATALDVLIGVVFGMRLAIRYRVGLLHARAHVPAIMALPIRWLTRCRFLFDLRGLMAEEYVDAGIWRANGILFRLTKWFERRLIRAADAVVVLTDAGKEFLTASYPDALRGKPCQVIPCCVDLRRTPHANASRPSEGRFTLAYVGKLGGWYPTDELMQFAAAAKRVIPELDLKIWTQSDPAQVRDAAKRNQTEQFVRVERATPRELPGKLAGAHAGVSFRTGNISRITCSPTKVAEYLAAGIPVVTNSGIGDCDALVDSNRIGVVIRQANVAGFEAAAFQIKNLASDGETRDRCTRVARDNFDLITVGWPRYCEIYDALSKA